MLTSKGSTPSLKPQPAVFGKWKDPKTPTIGLVDDSVRQEKVEQLIPSRVPG